MENELTIPRLQIESGPESAKEEKENLFLNITPGHITVEF